MRFWTERRKYMGSRLPDRGRGLKLKACGGEENFGWGKSGVFGDEVVAPAGKARTLGVVPFAVADVKDGGGRGFEDAGEVGEQAGIGFLEADFGGEEEVFEKAEEVQVAQDCSHAGVAVTEDGEAAAGGPQGGEGGNYLRENAPAVAVREGRKKIGEDAVKGGFGDGVGREGFADDGLPEARFGAGFWAGAEGVGPASKGGKKTRIERGGIGGETVLPKDFGIDFADGRMRGQKRAAKVKGQDRRAGAGGGSHREGGGTAKVGRNAA